MCLRTSSRTVSIALQTDKPIVAYGPRAAQAEQYGFDGVSVYNDLLFQPAWLPLLEIARNTHPVRIGPAAVNPFTCHPLNIAGNISLIDEAAQGRVYLVRTFVSMPCCNSFFAGQTAQEPSGGLDGNRFARGVPGPGSRLDYASRLRRQACIEAQSG
jgi:hypothetical protein